MRTESSYITACSILQDVGIDNGLHRVVQNLPAVRAADVVIVVAGMDGSLPSVIAGLVDSPVVRLPFAAYMSLDAASNPGDPGTGRHTRLGLLY